MAEGIAPLIFEIRAKASEVFTELGKVRSEFSHTATSAEADAKKTSAAMAKTGDTAEKASHKSKSSFDLMAGAGKAMAVGIVGAGLTVGGAAIKMGMDFQESMTTLVTGAGESEKNIGMVGDGILAMSGKVGQSAQDLASGMYLVESAGYHAGDGLKVLQAAAEGAKVGNADMKTVADGLTTTLTDYHLKASDAASVTSKLVTTVASGKTTMGDLAGSLSNVLPTAAAAKVGLDQVLGAMATMTGQGISADQASQNIANTLRSLSAPSAVASHAMAQIGINSTDLAANLGKKGLTGTLDQVYQAIMAKMGPGGLALENSFNQSKLAASSAKSMIDGLPKSLQKMAQGYLDGSVTQKEWTKELKSQPATVANLGKQFATVAKQATGFSDQLKSGSGSAQTFNAILSQVMGGATGMNTALALTGGNMATFKANVDSIGKASAESDGSVKGFAETQKDLKTKLENAKDGAEAMVTSLGMKLIPAVSGVLSVATKFGNWLTGHKPVLYAFAGVIGGVVVLAITAYIAKLTVSAAQTVVSFAKMIASGAKWVASTTVQVAQVTARFVAFAVQGIAKAVVAAATGFASMIASGATWLAQTTAQLAEAAARWVVYAATGIARTVAAAAVGFARMVAAGAVWAAQTAAQIARSIAAGAVWIAEHVAMAAAAVVQYGIMAAAATAAFIAENAATLGIGIAIAAVVAAIVWLATHWGQAWDAIKNAALWAYNNVIKPVGSWIMDHVIHPIGAAISWLGGIWADIWNGIGSVLTWVYNHTIGPIVNLIQGAISKVSGAVSTVSGIASKVGSFLGFANGGFVPGPVGAPRLAVVHGGEYVLSNDMLAGRQEPTDLAKAAKNANGYTAASSASQQALTSGASASGAPSVTVIANTNASPQRIAKQVGWELRAMA